MFERAELLESLKMNLQEMTLDEFTHLLVNETSAIEDYYKLCHGISAGQFISLLFNNHRLDTSTITSPISIYQSLKQDNLLNGLARLYLYNLEHGVNNAFFCAIQRGYNGIQYVNEFPPIVARNIIQRYGTTSDGEHIRVLDPCCGWGGRMIGCSSIQNTLYTGCEPSTRTYTGLLNLSEWLQKLQPKFYANVYNMPFEESDFAEKSFDMALTSPPYYDTEHYSDESTNSLNKFNTFESWIEGFYKPLILKTMSYIKDDGVFILNVGERKYPLAKEMYKIVKDAGLYAFEITDTHYLSGTGEGREKFYCISKVKKEVKVKKLF